MTIQKFVFRLIKRSSGLMMLVMVSVVLLSFQVSGKTFSKQQNVKKQTALNSTDKAELDILKKRINIKAVNSNLQVFLDRLSVESDVFFIYENELINKEITNLEFENEELGEILDKLLTNYDIGFMLLDENRIVIASLESLQDKTGRIKGTVTDEKGVLLPGANVIVDENKFGSACSHRGMYVISNLKPGRYTVKSSFIGYKPQIKTVMVLPGKTTELNFELVAESFQIGGIEVTAAQELLPTEVNSKTEINSGEIEHYQATHLGDVLDLVPGIQKTDNPGIGKTSKVAIRGGSEDALSAFGTKVIIDGIPISNNVNLQYESLVGSKFGGSTMGSSIDLRTIPADNLENIEVITGLPSVKYGDFTSGIINIKTKTGVSPHRLKIKTNPKNNETNLGGGFALNSGASLSYNANAATSQRDLRLDGDEFTRYTGQLVHNDFFFSGCVNNNIKFNMQGIYDEEEPENDYSKTNNYNRGFELGLADWGEYVSQGETSKIEYNAYVRMKRINSRKSKLLTSDIRVLPNGDSVTSYIGVVKNEGLEWTSGATFDWNSVLFTGQYIHKVLAGIQFSYEANTGDGIIIDTLFNYYGADSKKRSYSYDNIPAYKILSLYAEDKITGHLLFDFSLMFGFRYEMYNPQKFNITGLWGDGDIIQSKQGTYFNPRASILVYLSDQNQLRLSAGKTSKAPPLSSLYKPNDVLTWRNPYSRDLHYVTIDLKRPNLKGYSELQFEIGYDHKFFNFLGLSLTGYYKERNNEIESSRLPVFIETDLSGANELFYVDTYSSDENFGSSITKGIEFSLKTNKIKSINTTLIINGSYSYRNKPGSTIIYDKNPDESLGQYENYIVHTSTGDQLYGWTYLAAGNWKDQLQLNYYMQYTHPELGLWITLRAEQLFSDRSKKYNLEPVDESLLNPEKLISREYEGQIKTKPIKWLFNFSISKSLFPGAEVSFYVNNFLDDPAVYSYYQSYNTKIYSNRNPDLFYGLEFSMIFDEIIN